MPISIIRATIIATIFFIRPAHCHSVGLHDLASLRRKALRKRLQRIGPGHQRGALIQCRQAGALGLQMLGLLLYTALQAGIQILQTHSHAVEALGHGAKFISSAVRYPRREVA